MGLSQLILAEINQITTEIEDNYPELEKYLDERPDTLHDEKDSHPKVDDKALLDYLNDLKEMVSKYKAQY